MRGSSSWQWDSTPPMTSGMPRMPRTQMVETAGASGSSGGTRRPFDGGGRPRRAPQPGLEHQDRPDRARGVAAAVEIVAPAPLDALDIEIAFLAHAARIEQLLGPAAQIAAQPVGD